jgi:hypothetical protein
MYARHFGVTSTTNRSVLSVSVSFNVTSMWVSLNATVVAPQLTDSALEWSQMIGGPWLALGLPSRVAVNSGIFVQSV